MQSLDKENDFAGSYVKVRTCNNAAFECKRLVAMQWPDNRHYDWKWFGGDCRGLRPTMGSCSYFKLNLKSIFHSSEGTTERKQNCARCNAWQKPERHWPMRLWRLVLLLSPPTDDLWHASLWWVYLFKTASLIDCMMHNVLLLLAQFRDLFFFSLKSFISYCTTCLHSGYLHPCVGLVFSKEHLLMFLHYVVIQQRKSCF